METVIVEGKLALGSIREDFGTICADCVVGSVGGMGFRQAYFHADKTKLETFTRWMSGGGSKVVTQHPLKAYDYCYYHLKERGLLPYQVNGGKIGKQS
jgi:hypothetical protein